MSLEEWRESKEVSILFYMFSGDHLVFSLMQIHS